MKKILILIIALHGLTLFSQENEPKKLEYVIIADGKIITKAQPLEYGEQGLVKNMTKGVTQKERDAYAKLLGDKIGDRDFIIKVGLLTQQEKIDGQQEQVSNPKQTVEEIDRTKALFLDVNDVASDFTVQMVDNTEITLSDLKDKVVFINYWATWCAPCLMEFAEIPPKILEKFNKEAFVFIPSAIGENKEKVERKMLQMKTYGVDFNVSVDPKKDIWNQYATGAIPKSFLVDKNGIIKYVSIGNSEGNIDKLALEIEKLLSE